MATNDYLILFGDLIGSTEVASEASSAIFSRLYIASFQLAAKCAKHYITNPVFKTVRFSKTIKRIKLSGDEVLSFTEIRALNNRQKTDLVASAVAFAFVTKTFWMAAPYNLLRLCEKKFFRDLALGIHIGPAERISDDSRSEIAGLHINVTKRLETAARAGRHSRIFVSDDVRHFYNKWLDHYKDLEPKKAPPLLYTIFKHVESPLDLKGIPVKVSPFELQLNKVDEEKMQNLVELIYDTPHKCDAEAEDAVKILGDTILDILFANKSLCRQIGHIKTKKDYIDQWFSSVDCLPHLFLNDLWTVMVVFFISCGFIRHSGLSRAKKKDYQKIIDGTRDRLGALIREAKEIKP